MHRHCLIATVLKSGGQYHEEHVRRLAEQVSLVAPDARFVCLSDVPVDGVETRSLMHGWPGWWSKLELFRPDAFEVGTRVLYMDLDTTIVGDLSELLGRQEPFLAIGDFYRRPPRQESIGFASGLMMWTAGEQAHIYESFAANTDAIMARFERDGDQGFLERVGLPVTYWEQAVPGQVVSYKVHCRRGKVPDGARVVCFHGLPKPWHVPKLRLMEAVA